MKTKPRLNLVPPCAVSDKTSVEIRLAVPAGDAVEVALEVAGETVVKKQLPGGRSRETLVNAWWPTTGHRGRKDVRWKVAAGPDIQTGKGSVEVVPSQTVGLPWFGGVWIEPGAVAPLVPGGKARDIEAMARESVDAMADAGMRFLIIAYVEAGGQWYTPATVFYSDRPGAGTSVPLPGGASGLTREDADVIGARLSQASRRGIGVFMGLSRGGDMHLLWEFEKPGWKERNEKALAIGRQMADRLHALYGQERSFIGWYLSHEVNDLPKSAAYYDPLAEHCRSLASERVVMVAPAGTPIGSREIVNSSAVDIFCWQDAVGSGYVPFVNTWNPERRIAMLDDCFSRYRGWHEGGRKHCWADLEVWEMDGKNGYRDPYPPAFDRVRRQMEIESQYVPVLTAYAWHGYLHPATGRGKADPRAVALLRHYQDWRRKGVR